MKIHRATASVSFNGGSKIPCEAEIVPAVETAKAETGAYPDAVEVTLPCTLQCAGGALFSLHLLTEGVSQALDQPKP